MTLCFVSSKIGWGRKKCIFCLGLLNVFVRLMPPMGNKQKKVVGCQASAKWDNDNHVLS